MFKGLKRRLTLLYTLLAGVVLLVVALLCLSVAESQLRYAEQTAFESGVNAVLYKLQSDRMLPSSWLAQIEGRERQIVYIEDAGVPLAFQGAWTPETPRKTLIEAALARADESGLSLPLGSLTPASAFFELRGTEGDAYLAAVTLLPEIGMQPLRVVMLRDRSAGAERITGQRLTILLIALCGLVALSIGGWFYSGHALRPAEKNQARQVEFTAMAAHELKAPLAVLSAGVDALALRSDENQRALLRTLSGETLRMARLVDDLLLLARTDAAQWSLRAERVDFDTVLIDCYELFSPLAKEKNQRLTLTLPDAPLPPLRGDAERLKQLFSILLDNAIVYTEPGGQIRLCAEISGKHLRAFVEDSGIGISDAQKPRVFDRFYRADDAHQDRAHAGLGLSIARELAQMHGGKISVEDAHPQGTRFTVHLPLRPPQ